MKVKIGPYPKHLTCNIHSKYMVNKYGVYYEDNQTTFEHILEKLEDGIQCVYDKINQLYFFNKEQKRKVVIDDYDIWGMDYTLAHIVLPMLERLKDAKAGAPFVDDSDVPDNIKSTSAKPKENEWDTDEFHFQRWDYVLNEMIYAFELKLDDEWEYSSGISDDDRLKMHERQQNGFVLFGKYYNGLWS